MKLNWPSRQMLLIAAASGSILIVLKLGVGELFLAAVQGHGWAIQILAILMPVGAITGMLFVTAAVLMGIKMFLAALFGAIVGIVMLLDPVAAREGGVALQLAYCAAVGAVGGCVVLFAVRWLERYRRKKPWLRT